MKGEVDIHELHYAFPNFFLGGILASAFTFESPCYILWPFIYMFIYLFVLVELYREYKILNLLDFTSKRKRMSVIVRDEDGSIILFCKGADRLAY